MPNLKLSVTRLIAIIAVLSATITQFLPQLTDNPQARAMVGMFLAIVVILNHQIAGTSNPDGTPVNSTSEKTTTKTTVETIVDKPEIPPVNPNLQEPTK